MARFCHTRKFVVLGCGVGVGMLANMKTILDDCEKNSYAIGSFNVSSIDQVLAVIDAANLERSPALIQPIVGTTCYEDEARWWEMMREAIVRYSEVPIGLHLDHGLSYED